MAIPFRGQIDVNIIRRMNQIALTPPRRFLIWGGIAALAVFWATVVPWLRGGTFSLEGWEPVLFMALLFLGIVAYSLYMAPKKILQSNKLLQAPIVGEASDSGIHLETEHTRSEFPWDVFLRRKIGKDIVLLYQSIQITNVFPREFFASDTDWQAFVEMVRQRVPEAAPASRVGKPPTLKVLLIWMVIFIVFILVWNLFH